MKFPLLILFLSMLFALLPPATAMTSHGDRTKFEFYGDSISLSFLGWDELVFDGKNLSEENIAAFYNHVNANNYLPLVNHLLYYKQKNKLDDWFYYQLIRKTAQQLCPKQENFELYTLYKWFLLNKSGYDAPLALCENRLLFYVRSEDNIYDIPFYKSEGKQYVCLNYHDYGSNIDFQNLSFYSVNIVIPEAQKTFSYRVRKMPDFKNEQYAQKDLNFRYDGKEYDFKVLVNPEVKTIFANYPVVDYEEYFNIPMSKATYNSLIPELKKAVKSMSQKKGIDYLMHFSRSVFTYQSDQDAYGKEKRMSPEQTLLANSSDCDDRAAFFFALIKEIYNLPMIVILYPTHVTIAVQFDAGMGRPILYKEKKYYVCDPTPQSEDLSIGQQATKYKHAPYEIAYEYNPFK